MSGNNVTVAQLFDGLNEILNTSDVESDDPLLTSFCHEINSIITSVVGTPDTEDPNMRSIDPDSVLTTEHQIKLERCLDDILLEYAIADTMAKIIQEHEPENTLLWTQLMVFMNDRADFEDFKKLVKMYIFPFAKEQSIVFKLAVAATTENSNELFIRVAIQIANAYDYKLEAQESPLPPSFQTFIAGFRHLVRGDLSEQQDGNSELPLTDFTPN